MSDKHPHSRAARLVRGFHWKFGVKSHREGRARFATGPGSLRATRSALIQEESAEVVDALAHESLIDVAHELADLVVVAYGTADVLGINLDLAVERVMVSNFSKLQPDGTPLLRWDGKILKSGLYVRPDLRGVVDP